MTRAALSNRGHKQGWVYKANSDAKVQMRCSTVNPQGRGWDFGKTFHLNQLI